MAQSGSPIRHTATRKPSQGSGCIGSTQIRGKHRLPQSQRTSGHPTESASRPTNPGFYVADYSFGIHVYNQRTAPSQMAGSLHSMAPQTASKQTARAASLSPLNHRGFAFSARPELTGNAGNTRSHVQPLFRRHKSRIALHYGRLEPIRRYSQAGLDSDRDKIVSREPI